MLKRKWMYMGIIVIVLGFLITVSCAKKVVQSEPAVEEAAAAPAAAEVDISAQEKAAGQSDMKAEEDLRQNQLAEQAAKEAEVEKTKMADMQIFIDEDIYFDFDSSVLRDMAKNVLSRKAKWLRMNTDTSVIIEGHCDERGTSAYNIALGDRRAQSVKSYLVDLGIDAAQLTKISYGEERPVESGTGEKNWAKNRRAHFVVE